MSFVFQSLYNEKREDKRKKVASKTRMGVTEITSIFELFKIIIKQDDPIPTETNNDPSKMVSTLSAKSFNIYHGIF